VILATRENRPETGRIGYLRLPLLPKTRESGFRSKQSVSTRMERAVPENSWSVLMEQIRQGLAVYQSTGSRLGKPYYLSLLAESYGQAG
jgi:hypothetical protein